MMRITATLTQGQSEGRHRLAAMAQGIDGRHDHSLREERGGWRAGALNENHLESSACCYFETTRASPLGASVRAGADGCLAA